MKAWSTICGFEPREREYFTLALSGIDDDECATKMGIKLSMIASHRKHIVRKVNAMLRGRRREVAHFPDVLNIFYREVVGLIRPIKDDWRSAGCDGRCSR